MSINLNRRRFINRTALAGCIAVLGCLSLPSQANAKPDRPNILFILIDDMGWKDISCAGSTYYETPHIDKLASEGMRFLNAYSAAPVCSPSRGAIFTGKNPARTQFTAVWGGSDGPDDRLHDKSKYRGGGQQYLEARNRHALPSTEFILAQAFAEGGYQTGFFGKWHVGECPNYYPDDRGFQVAKGYRTEYVGTHTSGHWMKTFQKYAANLEGADKDAYVADVLTDECIQFITENKKKPWLAVLSHYLVHGPIQPKPEKRARYKEKPTTDQINPGMASMVESVDESVGRLIQTLKDLGLDQKTLVIFTSDNGGLSPNSTSNYPILGGKSFPFEGGFKVPFIATWPGTIKPGISKERIIGMDIYPTMLAAAGLPLRPEQHVDGLNLMTAALQGADLKERPLVFHYPHYSHATGPVSAIIEGDWKLIQFYNDAEGAYLLYNLADDPEERKDLAKANPEKRDALAKRLVESLKEMDAEMPIPNPKPKLGKYNLKFTKELAEEQRAKIEARLSQ